jgi:hypothetical protein
MRSVDHVYCMVCVCVPCVGRTNLCSCANQGAANHTICIQVSLSEVRLHVFAMLDISGCHVHESTVLGTVALSSAWADRKFSTGAHHTRAPPPSCVVPSWATVAHLATSEHTHVKTLLLLGLT